MKRNHKKITKDDPDEKDVLKKPKIVDFFAEHFCTTLDDTLSSKVTAGAEVSKKILKSPLFEGYSVTANSTAASSVHCTNPERVLEIDEFNLDPKVIKNFEALNNSKPTDEQKELYQIIGRYMDLCMVTQDKNYLPLLSLHVVNHLTRTRKTIIENNTRLEKLTTAGTLTDEAVEECRDQGIARPKVLFVTPMKKYAYEFVNAIADLTFGKNDKRVLMNSQRFEEEFGDNGYVPSEKKKQDYRELMSGNIDDCFRLGIQYAKKAMKLYQRFTESDILICSPLGLRMIVGEEGEAERETDFLASIEVLIVDRVNMVLMQNWEHLQHILDECNGMPSKLEVDISRARHWSLQNLGRIYRQTLIFSELNFTELYALYASSCKNYAGGVTLIQPPAPILDLIEKPLIQEFHRFDCEVPKYQSDLRFDYFTKNILPSLEHGTLIFVSSYFDFIRLRNYMKKENESFVQLHEYAKDKKIARARGMFYRRRKKLIVMTERFYYFKRYLIKNVASLVFYQLPVNPKFFIELINDSSPERRLESKVIFSKFDLFRMQNIFGIDQAKQLIKSEKKFHALVSE